MPQKIKMGDFIESLLSNQYIAIMITVPFIDLLSRNVRRDEFGAASVSRNKQRRTRLPGSLPLLLGKRS